MALEKSSEKRRGSDEERERKGERGEREQTCSV